MRYSKCLILGKLLNKTSDVLFCGLSTDENNSAEVPEASCGIGRALSYSRKGTRGREYFMIKSNEQLGSCSLEPSCEAVRVASKEVRRSGVVEVVGGGDTIVSPSLIKKYIYIYINLILAFIATSRRSLRRVDWYKVWLLVAVLELLIMLAGCLPSLWEERV